MGTNAFLADLRVNLIFTERKKGVEKHQLDREPI